MAKYTLSGEELLVIDGFHMIILSQNKCCIYCMCHLHVRSRLKGSLTGKTCWPDVCINYISQDLKTLNMPQNVFKILSFAKLVRCHCVYLNAFWVKRVISWFSWRIQQNEHFSLCSFNPSTQQTGGQQVSKHSKCIWKVHQRSEDTVDWNWWCLCAAARTLISLNRSCHLYNSGSLWMKGLPKLWESLFEKECF